MFNLKNKKEINLEKGFIPLETIADKFYRFKNKFCKNENRFLAGFTLVEMITAVAIFSMVMIIAMGALLAVINANKQNQAIQTAINNLSLAMEMMSREIRVGYSYHCGEEGTITEPLDCEEGDDYIAFEAFDGDPVNPDDQIVFKLEGTRIKRSDDGSGTFLFLTAPVVVLEELKFYVAGSSSSDDIQPRVLISASGYVDLGSIGERGKSYFNLQTTASQRIIDF